MSNVASNWALPIELPLTPKAVLLHLAQAANMQTGKCWPCVKTIARRVGCCVRTVRYALRELEEQGLIRTLHQVGRRSIYWVTFLGQEPPAVTAAELAPPPVAAPPAARPAPAAAPTPAPQASQDAAPEAADACPEAPNAGAPLQHVQGIQPEKINHHGTKGEGAHARAPAHEAPPVVANLAAEDVESGDEEMCEPTGLTGWCRQQEPRPSRLEIGAFLALAVRADLLGYPETDWTTVECDVDSIASDTGYSRRQTTKGLELLIQRGWVARRPDGLYEPAAWVVAAAGGVSAWRQREAEEAAATAP